MNGDGSRGLGATRGLSANKGTLVSGTSRFIAPAFVGLYNDGRVFKPPRRRENSRFGWPADGRGSAGPSAQTATPRC
jgi:hypothetical protein